MEADPNELKHGYADLSDEGLLAINRVDLTELAQSYYDAEIARRGLQIEPAIEPEKPVASPEEEWVNVATFLSIEEADMGRTLLQSADIPVFLQNELNPLPSGALRLMVPASFAASAEEILETRISDEDLAAQAEAAESTESGSGEEKD